MNILNAYQKTCPICMVDFQAERTNQIYCSKRCKVLKNNHKAKMLKEDYEVITYQTNQLLWSIRNFLKDHEGEEVTHEQVSPESFQLRYITHFYKDEASERNVFIIYDYGYYFINSTTIKIIKYA